jgi:hypothetical protein
MLAEGADVDTKYKWGHTTLMLAKKEGKKRLFECLKRQGQRNEGTSIFCGSSELLETFKYCYHPLVVGTAKNV